MVNLISPIYSLTAMLRNEVGWFDEEENSADTLSMRLANDATFVRAAFSNRVSIFIQDSAAVIVAVLIGMILEWRLALVALGTLPVLTISAIAQVCILYCCTFVIWQDNFTALYWNLLILYLSITKSC